MWAVYDWIFWSCINGIGVFDDIARGWCKAIGPRRFVDVVADMETKAEKKSRSHKKK